MGSPVRLGLNLPYVEGQLDGRTPRWRDMLAMARTAEAVGFDAVWVSDHVGFADGAGGWNGAWESWTVLTAIAARTERVEIGTYVSAAPFRNPALLAKMAETLDEVSGGRLILGLGAGWNEAEFEAYDFPFADRFDRFEDTLRIVTALLRTGLSGHEGRAVHARGARLEPRGPRPGGLPVMIGATGPRMLRLTAELADHWNGGLRTVEELVPILAEVDEACRAAGREPATLTRSAEALIRTLPDDEDAPPEERELRGGADELADALVRYADLGLAHIQVQLRPNSVDGVREARPVIEALRDRRRGR